NFVGQLLMPSSPKAVRVIFHCESFPFQDPGPEMPVSGGETGASLIRSALERLGHTGIHPRNARELTEASWAVEKYNNLILLDSPIGRERGGFVPVPHNRWADDVLKGLEACKVRPS